MKDSKHETPAAPGQAVSAVPPQKAEKVRSSRYEWESKAGDNQPPAPIGKNARGSLMSFPLAWLKRLFSLDRNFFDNDDDATPSTA